MDLFVDFAYESLYKYGEELCGDKVEFVRNEDFSLAVLADGLGSGVKANILATLTSKIIATMLSSGATLDEAIETIASTLPVCSQRGIAYSTFTILHVENNGEAYISEFDNPSLVYMKNDIIAPIKRREEMLSGKRIFISNLTVEQGDMLISFSDGVVHAGVGSLLDLGWQYDNIVKYIEENIKQKMSPTEVSRKILLAVNALYMQKCGDDSTVCVLKIKPNTPVTIMVGPPVDEKSDDIVVR
ncbi:MAG: serine/threonine protein phosphatase, partial [Oscillospiraceae bacterium]|nr:serine/threonine protein phosphatase [Oscillospiraceae bacterium]